MENQELYDYGHNNPENTRQINTEDKLIKYIRRMLGEPMIQVEVPDESIQDIIYETVLKFQEYNWGGEIEKAFVMKSEGRGIYQFREEVQEVFQVKTQSGVGGSFNFSQNYGQGYVPDLFIKSYSQGMQDIMSTMVTVSSQQAMQEKYFSKEPLWKFSQGRNTLELQEDYKGNMLVHYSVVYQPQEVDFIYNHPWVKEYCIQKTKFLWGTITGKYSQALVGGQQINYSDMKSEAESDLQRLHEELLNKYTDPQPIDIQ